MGWWGRVLEPDGTNGAELGIFSQGDREPDSFSSAVHLFASPLDPRHGSSAPPPQAPSLGWTGSRLWPVQHLEKLLPPQGWERGGHREAGPAASLETEETAQSLPASDQPHDGMCREHIPISFFGINIHF